MVSEEKRITLRLPGELAAQVDANLAGESLNAWLVDAARRKLTGLEASADPPKVEPAEEEWW